MLDKHMPGGHNFRMAEVIGSDEFDEWFQSLDEADTDAVARVVDMLEMQGPTLPFPYSSAIKGSSKVALRELRVQSHGRPIRVFYAFDPVRQAVLLIGGDKTGKDRFYETMVPQAERIFARYLQEFER
jgi:hypothetical protein